MVTLQGVAMRSQQLITICQKRSDPIWHRVFHGNRPWFQQIRPVSCTPVRYITLSNPSPACKLGCNSSRDLPIQTPLGRHWSTLHTSSSSHLRVFTVKIGGAGRGGRGGEAVPGPGSRTGTRSAWEPGSGVGCPGYPRLPPLPPLPFPAPRQTAGQRAIYKQTQSDETLVNSWAAAAAADAAAAATAGPARRPGTAESTVRYG